MEMSQSEQTLFDREKASLFQNRNSDLRENKRLVVPVPASEKGFKPQFAPFQWKLTH